MAKKRAKTKDKSRRGVIIAAAAVCAVLAAVSAFGVYVTGTDRIFKGVSVSGTALGGMTRQQAVAALEAGGWDDGGESAVTVRLPLEKH
ncbi:MAG TPA: hypothetical protein DC001_00095, partial [Clostridiales bacterium]|nr:hypothetical protein [Clostridiales bacterium]